MTCLFAFLGTTSSLGINFLTSWTCSRHNKFRVFGPPSAEGSRDSVIFVWRVLGTNAIWLTTVYIYFSRRYGRDHSGLEGNFQFIGCMTNVTLNGKKVDLNYPGGDVKREHMMKECTSCKPSPCKNNGTCIAREGLVYSCRCPQSFTGFVCEIPGMFIFD